MPPRSFEPSESGSETVLGTSSCGITDRFLAKETGAIVPECLRFT